MNDASQPKPPARLLLTLYTRTPLHVGSGASAEVTDQPIMRERITSFPIIPGSSLKGVLRDHARHTLKNDAVVRILFGEDRPPKSKEEAKKDNTEEVIAHAGCVQFMEAKLLAFPVRSLAGCFAWLTCPAALQRFQRDTDKLVTRTVPNAPNGRLVPIQIAAPERDRVFLTSGSELSIPNQSLVVFEEYALSVMTKRENNPEQHDTKLADDLVAVLKPLCTDSLWTEFLPKRLAIIHDENFQHFVTTCTEVVTRIAIDPATRVVDGGKLFNQENVPCETIFYTVITVLPEARKPKQNLPPDLTNLEDDLFKLLPAKAPAILQIGGDETTGHGFCAVQGIALGQPQPDAKEKQP